VPPTRYRRVALLGDVHGNAPALEAVLAELDREQVDAVVSGGDLTWGPFPRETLELVRARPEPWLFVRGNSERMLLEIARGETEATPAGSWVWARHRPEDLDVLATFAETVVLDIEGVGRVRVCHGSPRSDEEIVTERTPPERLRALLEGVPEHVVVTHHVHVRYDRLAEGVRFLSPGSVGLPYEGERGACWALLGPELEHRRTSFDVDALVDRMRELGGPLVERTLPLVLEPPGREEAIDRGEELVFAG
jgi:predicted phosphodiesterase